MRCSVRVLPLCARIACVSSLAIIAAPSTAQAVGDWRAVPTATTVPSRSGFSLAEMPNGDLLLFGGDSTDPTATEWRWNGVDWRPYGAGGVPRRDNAAIGKYANYGLVVYGGTTAGTFFTDTWRTPNGINWYVYSQGANPGILSNTSMAYDPATDRMVMVGQNMQGLYTTWFYEFGQGWSAGPTFAAADARVVSDEVRGEALLLEGGFPMISVSRMNAGVWESVGQSQTGLSLGEVGFDARRSRVVLMQPFDTLDTAEWDGLTFGNTTQPTGTFRSPLVTAMTYHSDRGEMIYVVDGPSGLETYRHAVAASPSGFEFGPTCGINFGPTLRLAAGSEPRPGTVHRLEGTANGLGLTLSAIGFSHTMTQGMALPLSIPIGSGSCSLLVDPAIVTLLGTSATPSQLIAIPNSTTLLAERYNAQLIEIIGASVGTSNGLELQVGMPIPEQTIVEDFTTDLNRDSLASGDTWGFGQAVPARIGGDGRHGSFYPELGLALGGGVFEFNTDLTEIPAANTLANTAEVITDGRYFFTDFVVPAGVTLRFRGSKSPQIFVRGKTDIRGVVSVNGDDQPGVLATGGTALGQKVSEFNARMSLTGQPGTAGGPGAGAGGNGGDRCLNSGPIIVGGVNLTNGQSGDDVRVPAGHAYAASTVDTGGAGSELMPANGIWATPTPTISFVWASYFSPGGGGGGFLSDGNPAQQPQLVLSTNTIAAGPAASGGLAFPILPAPSGSFSSLEHFSVAGSGGGGGGSHSYGLLAIGSAANGWMAGHGGTGGGGAIAIRSGGPLTVDGTVSARGGDGALITGTPAVGSPVGILGYSSPGGGGSGGSVLLQSSRTAQVSGVVDTRGGTGSAVGSLQIGTLNVNAGGGDGSDGYYRVEGSQTFFTGLGIPAYSPTVNRGPINDTDALTGSRSKWLLPPSVALPVYVRYELLVDIGGLPVLFSDDPSVSPLVADDPNGAVMLRFQGAKVDAVTGQAMPGTAGPWRTHLMPGDDSVNKDRAQAIRFDIVSNKASTAPQVLDLRIIWQ